MKRAEVAAVLKPLAEGVYRIRCGRPHPCPGLLGYTRNEYAAPARARRPDPDPEHEALVQRIYAEMKVPTERWAVWHPWGLRWDGSAAFRVLHVIKPARTARTLDYRPTGKRQGRRPTPEALLEEKIRRRATKTVGGADASEVDEDRLRLGHRLLSWEEQREVVGLNPSGGPWAPELPLVIICPVCDHPNRAAAPPKA